MSLLPCHECYSWVRPSEGRCPDCTNAVDITAPDPPLEHLQAAIGGIIARLGEVRVKRPLLPDNGMLYATTNGLFFLPHQIRRLQVTRDTDTDDTSLFWSLAGIFWTPLLLVRPLVTSKRPSRQQVTVFRPQYLSPDQSDRLPALLMQNPGVFFVAKSSIRIMQRRRRDWLIERHHRPNLKLKPSANRERFHTRMQEIADSQSWRDIVFGT